MTEFVDDQYFFTINDYNRNYCLSVPFQANRETNLFSLAQMVYARTDGYMYFYEVLDAITDYDNKENFIGLPFGYDGSYRNGTIVQGCVCVRDSWNPIWNENIVFTPIEYIVVNGEPQFDKHHLGDTDALIGALILDERCKLSKKFIDEIGFDAYYKSSNPPECKAIVNRFESDMLYEYTLAKCEKRNAIIGDCEVVLGGVCNTFEEFIKIFPKYRGYTPDVD